MAVLDKMHRDGRIVCAAEGGHDVHFPLVEQSRRRGRLKLEMPRCAMGDCTTPRPIEEDATDVTIK